MTEPTPTTPTAPEITMTEPTLPDETSATEEEQEEDLSIDEAKKIVWGTLQVLKLRLHDHSEICEKMEKLWESGKYVQFLTFLHSLQLHYQYSEKFLAGCCGHLADTVDSICDELGMKDVNDKCFLVDSLEGILYYVKYCFKDNKHCDSQQADLYKIFKETWKSQDWFALYGMLLSCQELFQNPDKRQIWDMVYNYIIILCPKLV